VSWTRRGGRWTCYMKSSTWAQVLGIGGELEVDHHHLPSAWQIVPDGMVDMALGCGWVRRHFRW
jgi:hypothetical protein